MKNTAVPVLLMLPPQPCTRPTLLSILTVLPNYTHVHRLFPNYPARFLTCLFHLVLPSPSCVLYAGHVVNSESCHQDRALREAVHLNQYYNAIKYFSTAAHVSAYSTLLFWNLKAIFSNMIVSIATEIHSILVGVLTSIR